MAPLKADVKDADDWWHNLPDDRRVSYWHWLTGQGKKPPAPRQTEALFSVEEAKGAAHVAD